MDFIQPTYTTQNFIVEDDGVFPNNPLPVIIYKSILHLPYFRPGEFILEVFKHNNWSNAWKNGMYDMHHYHSNTHEVLGVYKGKTMALIGGEKGVTVELEKGDVIIIPAGVAHKNLEPQNVFKCVGAYPKGKSYDMNYGRDGERPIADHYIEKVPLPAQDPVFGYKLGEMQKLWFN